MNEPTNSSGPDDLAAPSKPTDLARATPPPDAPAVSHVRTETGPQIVLLGLHANQGLADKVLVEIEAAIMATTAIWDATAQEFANRPDYKTRLAACELYLAHTVGLPVQRSENLNINARAGAGQAIRKKAGPMEIEAMERRLARAKKEAAEESKASRPPHTA
jgi:hypothetical protein